MIKAGDSCKYKRIVGFLLIFLLISLLLNFNPGLYAGLYSAMGAAVPDLTPPATPVGLAVYDPALGGILDLAWNANQEPDLAGYNLYRSSTGLTGVFYKITPAPVLATSYRDTGLTSGTGYYYKISAVDIAGNESPQSAPVAGTPTDLVPPDPPAGLNVINSGVGGQLNIDWMENTEPDLAGYNIYRSTSPSGAFTLLNAALLNAGTGYADTGLTDGQAYYYRVTAVDYAYNESRPSTVASGISSDTIPPVTPSDLAVNDPGGGNRLDLSWTPNTETDLAGYHIYRSASAAGPFNRVNSAVVTSTAYSDTGLTEGVTYYYQITAVDRTGNESPPTLTVSGIPTRAEPSVAAVTPLPGATGVGTNRAISVTFNLMMDPATINTANFMVRDNLSTVVYAAYLTYDDVTKTATFLPKGPLQGDTLYVVTLTTGIKSLAGVPMAANYSWSFTTSTSPLPNPHGLYRKDTDACKNCHSTHYSVAPQLLNQVNETQVCFSCHDGLGSNTDIKGSFASNSGNASYHPVKDTQAVAAGLLKCSDCHNAHGDLADPYTFTPS